MTEKEEHLILLDEEGKEHNFEVIDILEVSDNEYAILLPVEEESDADSESQDDDAIIFRIVDEGDDKQTLLAVEDDNEWEQVAAAWEEKIKEIEEEGFDLEDEEEVE